MEVLYRLRFALATNTQKPHKGLCGRDGDDSRDHFPDLFHAAAVLLGILAILGH